MKRILGFLVMIALGCSIALTQTGGASQGSSGDVEKQISDLMEQSRQAALKGDSSWAEQHMADNFTAVNGIGERVAKSEAISRMKQGRMKYQSIEQAEHYVTVHGDSAVYQGKSRVKATRDGQDISGEYWGTWFWVKEGGTWKLVASQSTPVRQAGK